MSYLLDDPHVKKMYVTRDIQFHKNIPFFSSSECSLQGETVQNTFEDNTPNHLPSVPDLSSPDLSLNHPSLSNLDLNQDNTSSQYTPEANESPDVHSKVKSFPLNPPLYANESM